MKINESKNNVNILKSYSPKLQSVVPSSVHTEKVPVDQIEAIIDHDVLSRAYEKSDNHSAKNLEVDRDIINRSHNFNQFCEIYFKMESERYMSTTPFLGSIHKSISEHYSAAARYSSQVLDECNRKINFSFTV